MPETSKDRPVVMVSSTARDLPEHREHVRDACLRMGMYPSMMEHLPAIDADAIAVSLALVDEAEIYLGVFAHRYGYVPADNNPRHISITEMEYDRAVERGIPRLIFLMHDDHPIKAADVETGDGAEKLKALKARVGTERVRDTFVSPEDLRGKIIHALTSYRKPDLTKFHYVSDIPAPPESFIAHPYTLLQTHRLVGRQPELNLLTDWVAKPDAEVYKARILNVVAVGGMGKSALTWKWFNDIAPQEMSPLAGRLWWSFYESDATFENFITRALAYTTRRPLSEVQQIPASDRETQLLAALNHEPFLLVLDGLERILIAYARMDAARLKDSQVSNQRNLRKHADPRVGRFLKKLAQVKNSRILVSTRLYPAELETEGGDPMPGSFRLDITGLTDEDAVELWRALSGTAARDLLLPIFATFDKHPLLIQALAGEVKRYRRAPGNFEKWRKANPRFDPTTFELLHEAMSHVLEFALRGLDERALRLLQTIAAFRMPAHYDTLVALLIGEGKACADEHELDKVLTELENRGLVGWDRRANRYDLHPIVRGVVWSDLSTATRRGVYTRLHAHFKELPGNYDRQQVSSFDDLTPAVELYNTLIGLDRYDDAYEIFDGRIRLISFYRLSANRQIIELLEMLFPQGAIQLPRLSRPIRQAFVLNTIAAAYVHSGQHGRAVELYSRSIEIWEKEHDKHNLGVDLENLSEAMRLLGAIRESENAVRRALFITRERKGGLEEVYNLLMLGLTLAARGLIEDSESALRRSLKISAGLAGAQSEGCVNACLAQLSLWLKDPWRALRFANRASELAAIDSQRRDSIRAARLQGEAALRLKDVAAADERLHHVLHSARTVNLVEEELPALVALAELRRAQGDLKAAREMLDDVWEAAERGPYPLFHADACCVLAEVERDEGNVEKAVEAAVRAYRLAWCDGPPFAYHWGLESARALLKELGAGEPSMPAFDASRFEPMPEVEIDPADEFGAGTEGEG